MILRGRSENFLNKGIEISGKFDTGIVLDFDGHRLEFNLIDWPFLVKI